ncbi:MAG TPA: aminotransferase class I/II-fold pyridoxal phosphate-dependent enzyme [Gaiellaceae bacterium]|nr:aminotransferase class I/II-fold pyridoxal phosphate-dependent enzyme [Gaiellaceae bacterium]
MSQASAGDAASQIRPALAGLVPYEPGKPVEEVQRELGLERVVKLASNEGPYGPFPQALEALERATLELNRYPDGGAWRLRSALAERHGVRFEEVTVCAGADAVVGYVCQATLDPGDEVVTAWPSFPSYVLDPLKLAATPVRVPLRDEVVDLEALLEAITPRTKLVFVAAPNNPTGTTNLRDELDDYFERVPGHVLTVLDQAYFEYIDEPGYPEGVAEYFRRGRRVLVLRTFSKIYGLAGLRVGYGVGPADVITAVGKVRRAFDVTSSGQEAALASLGVDDEVEHRRAANRDAMTALERILREHGYEPAGPAVANFLFVRVGDAAAVNGELLRRGVIVRPLGSFGAPDALRITVGTSDELEVLATALADLAGVTASQPSREPAGA